MSRIAEVRQLVEGWVPDRVPEEDVLGRAITAAAEGLRPRDVVTGDSGNFAGWVQRAFKFDGTHKFISTSCGAMGMGVPAAVAAALRNPGSNVLSFCGDGGFLMNGNEFITACARGLSVKVFVANNRSYGTIRTHQQRAFPGRTSGTDLHNPDFAAMAVAFGARGFVVDQGVDIDAVVEDALARPGPALIDIRCDKDYSLSRSIAAQAKIAA
jgi:acetolactate synthase-1/2/3 large subunit